MQNFRDTVETRKRSFISAFSVCMTKPLILHFFLSLNSWSFLFLSAFVHSFITINNLVNFPHVFETHLIETTEKLSDSLSTSGKSINFQEKVMLNLTHFSPVSHFYTPWKRQKTFGFLTFSGGIEIWHWTKMG